ncbi:MAG: hypothetical protein U0736_23540 [Gemmataceae bacterium]
MRRCLSAALVLVAIAGFVLAEPVRGIITSVDSKEVKITVRKKGEKEGEPKVFKVTGDTTFHKAASKDKKDKIEPSEATSLVEKAAKGKAKGAFGVVDVDGDKATDVTIMAGRPGGKGKDKGKKTNP